MKTNYLSPLIIVCLLSSTNSFKTLAQTKPDWEVSPAKRISWQRSTTLGSILISSEGGLSCIDNIDGSLIWERKDLKGTIETNVEEISNSPFILIGSGKIEILDLLEGKTVFSSLANNFTQVTKKQFLYQNNTVFIGGYKNNSKKMSYSMIDMNTGKELWGKENGEFEFFLGCFSVDQKDVIVATGFDVFRIDARTGKEIWKKPSDQKMKNLTPQMAALTKGLASALGGEALMQGAKGNLFLSPNNKDQFFVTFEKQGEKEKTNGFSGGVKTTNAAQQKEVGYVTSYNCFNVNTGDFTWDKPIEVEGHIAPYYATSKGLAITDNRNTRINLYDYTTGKALWGTKGKGFKMAGEASFIIEMNNKLIVASLDLFKSRINVYNLKDGISSYDEKVDKITGEVTELRDLAKGLLVVTSETSSKKKYEGAVNMLNLATGKYYFTEEIKSNQSLITQKDDNLYIYDYVAGCILVLNENGTTTKKLNSAPIKFQGKEVPTKIEANADGIFLSSDQNIALVDYKGKIIFQKYYEAPGESGFMNALHIAAAVYATTVALKATVVSASMAATTVALGDTKKNTTAHALQPAFANASVGYAGLAVDQSKYAAYYMSKVNARYKATSAGNDFVVILHRNPEKKCILMILSKKSGELVKQVDISKDKTPNYSVDFVDKALYYIQSDKLNCYKF